MTSPHFLQGPDWAQFQRKLGNEVIERSGDGWSYHAIVEHGRGSARLYCPYGPTVDDAAGLRAAIKDLREQAQKRRLIFVRIEPRGEFSPEILPRLGLQPAQHNVQPADTSVVDVSADEETLLARMTKPPRRMMRVAAKAGVTYEHSTDPADVESFIEHINDVASRTGMQPHAPEYFRELAKTLIPLGAASFVFSELDGERIASAFLFHSQDTDYYAHAASLTEHNRISPAIGLAIDAMKRTHERGASSFDLFGIAPEGTGKDHPWYGFTRFKLAFGGDRVELSGTWELPVRSLQYRVYRLALSAAERGKKLRSSLAEKKAAKRSEADTQ